MGLAIDRERFEEAEFPPFVRRLEQSLQALRELVARPGFGDGPASLGAELELCLVDARSLPLPRNAELLAKCDDPRLTVELNRFNLECNLRPSPLAGRPFGALTAETESALAELRRGAAELGGRIVAIGILPTLTPEHLQRAAMTDRARYRALSWGLQRLRGEAFRLRIAGEDPLEISCDDVTFEGAATSLQVHLRVRPSDFAAVYNGVQLATAPALALAANSPTFLGHRLWHETRVALFKQAVDSRPDGSLAGREARVSFGTGWLGSGGAVDLFAENVAGHPPLLPILGEEDPLACVRGGGVPALEEMRLHQGTVWRWNRAIYDPVDGGHLRIEMRSFPAGPTTRDMAANAAFLIGAALDLAPEMDDWIAGMPFDVAESNFYRAAKHGPEAQLHWPPAPGAAPEPRAARDVVADLLPRARRGLEGAGVAPDEAAELIALVEDRAATGQTGSVWQRRSLAALDPKLGRPAALAAVLERYLALAAADEPVHRWPVDS